MNLNMKNKIVEQIKGKFAPDITKQVLADPRSKSKDVATLDKLVSDIVAANKSAIVQHARLLMQQLAPPTPAPKPAQPTNAFLKQAQEEFAVQKAAVDAQTAARAAQLANTKAAELATSISNQSKSLIHQMRAADYVKYEEAKAYVNSLKAEVKSEGTKATNVFTGEESFIRIADDRKSLYTFEPCRAGIALEIKGLTYYVSEYDYSPAGSTADLMPARHSAFIAPKGTKQTPSAFIDVPFDPATLTLHVLKARPLRPNDLVTINGKTFQPKYSLYGSVTSGTLAYQLEPVSD